MKLEQVLVHHWATAELKSMAARWVEGRPEDVTFWESVNASTLSIMCGGRTVLTLQLETRTVGIPRDDVWWSLQLSAAHALLSRMVEVMGS